MTAATTDAKAPAAAKPARTRKPSGTERPNVTHLPDQLAPGAVRITSNGTYHIVERGRSGKPPKQMWLGPGEQTVNMIAALLDLPEAAQVLAARKPARSKAAAATS